jgi:hypothetical protein
MRFNKVIVLLFLLLFSALATAQVHQITTRTIQVNVDETGNAEITEKFFLSFPNDFHLEQFRTETEKIGVDLVAWQQFNPGFTPSIGSGPNTGVSDIGFIETESKYLEMHYTLDEPIMNKTNETSRMTEYSLNSKFFSGFIEGSFWVIPEAVTIIIDLPLQSEIQLPVKPEANVLGNRVIWTGYKSTNVISLTYLRFKQIASLNLNDIVVGVMESEFLPLLIAIAIIGAIVWFWKRKAIAARIESYIIEHSDLSGMENED